MRSIRKHSRKSALAAALAAVVLLPGGSARALDDSKPVPDCQGLIASDPAGDQGLKLDVHQPIGLPVGGPNLDITRAFFKVTPTPDAIQTTVNIQVASLTRDVPLPLPVAGVGWIVFYTVGDTIYYAEALIFGSGSQPTFEAGTFDPILNVQTPGGAPAGKLFEGTDGVVQIQIASELKGGVGNKLTTPFAQSFLIVGSPDAGFQSFLEDDAPDSEQGRDFLVQPCPDAAAPVTVAPAANPDAVLPVKVSGALARARTANRRRAVTVTVTAAEPIAKLSGTLRALSGKGPVLGFGRLAKLNSKGKLKVVLRRRLKPGHYRLALRGIASSGVATATAYVTLK